MDIHSKKAESIIFNGGLSYVDELTFDLNHREAIIRWIERETGFNDGAQFEFLEEKKESIRFKACIDGIAVFPSGYIECKYNKKGKLILFSVYGQFPPKQFIRGEKYSLSLKQVESFIMEQFKLIRFPMTKQKK